MSNKTFKVAGITTHGDMTKVRFTDDLVRRIKQFTKGGATRCDFVDLPTEMTKIEALEYLRTHPDFQSPSDQATISDSLADRAKAPKAEVKVKANKPSVEAIKARAKAKVAPAVETHATEPVTE